jgi:hypothetical protein
MAKTKRQNGGDSTLFLPDLPSNRAKKRPPIRLGGQRRRLRANPLAARHVLKTPSAACSKIFPFPGQPKFLVLWGTPDGGRKTPMTKQ